MATKAKIPTFKTSPHPLAIIGSIIFAIIGIVGWVLYMNCKSDSKKTKEGLCVCAGVDTESCRDRDLAMRLYRSGVLTEYTDLDKMRGRNAQWS